MSDESIIISVPEDAAEADPKGATAVISDSPESGIEDLKRQLAEARQANDHHRAVAEEEGRRRAEAENAARQYAGQATAFRGEANQREYESLLNALSSVQQGLEAAQKDYAKAMEAGDYDAAAKIQVHMGRLSARAETMEAGRAQAEAQRNAQPAQRQPAPQQQQPQIDWNRAWSPQEAEAVMRDKPAQTAAWMRAHPQFFNDPGFRKQVIGADTIAQARGIQPGTEDYFRFVEQTVGLAGQDSAAEREQQAGHSAGTAQAPAPRAPAMPSAAPSRQVPGASHQAGSARAVSLTAAERDMAASLFPKQGPNDPDPEVAYATYKLQAERDGMYARVTGQR